METEIEAKFLDVNHDKIRAKLKELRAHCEHPMQLMRRKLFDHPDKRFQKNNQSQRLRIRDEGNSVLVNYKSKNKTKYAYEIETSVGSFDNMTKIFEAIGLYNYSFQESKRETWKYKNVEIVLDEWPWLNPYIEIEGPTEKSIQAAAKDLGFEWDKAKFGSVDVAYKHQYPGMTEDESIGDLPEVQFGKTMPDYLMKRKK